MARLEVAPQSRYLVAFITMIKRPDGRPRSYSGRDTALGVNQMTRTPVTR